MAPHSLTYPSAADRFFANYQYPILMSTFVTQVCHYQFIRRTEPGLESSASFVRGAGFPRPLRAGLGWAVVFVALLTRITIAKIALRDFSDPILAQPRLRDSWKELPQQGDVSHVKDLDNDMSADFLAGYISGAAGILIGNPLDLIKVRLQSGPPSVPSSVPSQAYFTSYGSLIRGATAPILGYGALNALLFVTYNRTSSMLTHSQGLDTQPTLWTAWLAGAVGGLATWAVSTPTELVKCRVQVMSSREGMSSWGTTREILRAEGLKGLYAGGVVTAMRDSIGYGFYFWSYELSSRFLEEKTTGKDLGFGQEAAKVLLCGGLAGVITWASVFPLDVIKTRVQTQGTGVGESAALLNGEGPERTAQRRLGAVEIARNAYRNEGIGVFFRGLGVCSVRAFVVNAVQWAVYEWIMRELDPKRSIESSQDRPT